MNVWLLIVKFSPPGPTGNKYGLTILNPDPKDFGLSKTPISDHSFPTIGAVTKFLVTHCNPQDFQISKVEEQLGSGVVYVSEVSVESARQMGFEV